MEKGMKLPPLPEGFELESSGSSLPPLPPGFELVNPQQSPSRKRSLINAPLKGFIKGAKELNPISPENIAKLIIPSNNQEKLIEKVIPTQNRPLEKGLERVGRLAPMAATGGEGLIAKGVRTGLGAIGGQIAEEFGAPEGLQSLAELSAFIGPKFSSKLTPAKSQEKALEFLKRKGLSDKEITPLIQSEKKLRKLGKFASKKESTGETLKTAGEKIGQGFEDLKVKAKESNAYLPRDKTGAFLDEFDKSLNSIRPRFKRLLGDDVKDFENSRMGFNDIVDFWQDINATVKGQEGGRAVLNKLKGPLQKGLQDINPELANEFNLLNEFYAKKAKVGKLLAPKQIDEFLDAGKTFGLMASIATGNIGFIKKILGTIAGRNIANSLLTNPRLQNLSNQMLKAINNNKIPESLKIFSTFQREFDRSKIEPTNAKKKSSNS
jgi:hypothetical protein